eukprot:CAMPEP_0117422654 /NCGR_PEP_ID=MMETSP0758-20121206/3456_1 /TAXON_ID=63605 /ORGANISM="Percolomonas cosmopolitus, Strain AE-1 (ATCC 50343)" /LENGTH=187 /DNA_ID=CAMNT_0005205415 /DNA_START=786 /DNA_END=1350 /DNA_ORIENTATION=+
MKLLDEENLELKYLDYLYHTEKELGNLTSEPYLIVYGLMDDGKIRISLSWMISFINWGIIKLKEDANTKAIFQFLVDRYVLHHVTSDNELYDILPRSTRAKIYPMNESEVYQKFISETLVKLTLNEYSRLQKLLPVPNKKNDKVSTFNTITKYYNQYRAEVREEFMNTIINPHGGKTEEVSIQEILN